MILPPTRAAFFRSPTDVIVRERPTPAPAPHEIIVEIDACGICGTDLTDIFEGKAEYSNFGHEIAGRIIATGDKYDTLPVGTPIVLESSSACGRCDNCRNMRQEFCQNVTSFWPSGLFGFAGHMPAPGLSAIAYDGMSPEVASLSEPLGVALDMLRLADLGPHSIVLVSGLGPIGLMAVRLARLAGARRIYATSYSRLKLRNETALLLGADQLIFEDQTPVATFAFPEKPDRFLLTTPPQVLPAMFQAAAHGAILTYIGIKPGDGARVTFDANQFHFKKLQLRASFASPALLTPLALRLLRDKSVDGGLLITHRFSLDEMPEAVRVACFEKERCIKVVMVRS